MHEELKFHLNHMSKRLYQHGINSKISLQLIDYFQYDDYIHVKSKLTETDLHFILHQSNIPVDFLHHQIISKL